MRWLDVTRNLWLMCSRAQLKANKACRVHDSPKLVTKLHKSWKKLVHEGTISLLLPDGPNQVQI